MALYEARRWVGWQIVGKEMVTHPAGVEAHIAEARWDKFHPARATSSGRGYEGYHLERWS